MKTFIFIAVLSALLFGQAYDGCVVDKQAYLKMPDDLAELLANEYVSMEIDGTRIMAIKILRCDCPYIWTVRDDLLAQQKVEEGDKEQLIRLFQITRCYQEPVIGYGNYLRLAVNDSSTSVVIAVYKPSKKEYRFVLREGE
ncbi:MAG: hypothetical protein V1707_02550 [bacterium]